MKQLLPASTFIKWFIIFAAIFTGNVIAATYGLQSRIVQSDVSCLSSVIAGTFLIGSLMAGRLAYRVSRRKNLTRFTLKSKDISPLEIKRSLMVLNFLPSAFFMIGILGTVAGVYTMMEGTLNGNDVSQMLAQIKAGFATKLFVTGTGVVSALLLMAQILVIEHDTTCE